jgi:hypothetical protein
LAERCGDFGGGECRPSSESDPGADQTCSWLCWIVSGTVSAARAAGTQAIGGFTSLSFDRACLRTGALIGCWTVLVGCLLMAASGLAAVSGGSLLGLGDGMCLIGGNDLLRSDCGRR